MTLRDLLLDHRVQMYKEPRFTDSFEYLSCLVVGTNYHFIPASTENQTQVACMYGLCLNHRITLSFPMITHDEMKGCWFSEMGNLILLA